MSGVHDGWIAGMHIIAEVVIINRFNFLRDALRGIIRCVNLYFCTTLSADALVSLGIGVCG